MIFKLQKKYLVRPFSLINFASFSCGFVLYSFVWFSNAKDIYWSSNRQQHTIVNRLFDLSKVFKKNCSYTFIQQGNLCAKFLIRTRAVLFLPIYIYFFIRDDDKMSDDHTLVDHNKQWKVLSSAFRYYFDCICIGRCVDKLLMIYI